jgi:hypothetical protein
MKFSQADPFRLVEKATANSLKGWNGGSHDTSEAPEAE